MTQGAGVVSEATRTGPVTLIAELTHRCPLGCPYCSNPQTLVPRDEELDAVVWSRVFGEAAALGMTRAELSGGEPGARRDLVDITAHAREAGLATHLITSGVGITTRTMRDLWEAGLDRVQVSFQDAGAVSSDRIANQRGAFQRKHALAAEAVRIGLPLTVGVVLHRDNIENLSGLVDLALGLKAQRVAFAMLQNRGWAAINRSALRLSADQMAKASADIEALRGRHGERIGVDVTFAGPDDGRSVLITPSGDVVLGQPSESDAVQDTWNVRDRSLSEIVAKSPAFAAWRGRPVPSHAAEPEPPFSATPAGAAYVYRRM